MDDPTAPAALAALAAPPTAPGLLRPEQSDAVTRRGRVEPVARIDSGGSGDLASLAVELGWFDQAHFTRDFTALVGQSPAAYAERRPS